MSVFPTLLVGIGSFGIQVLAETACQIRQSYGAAGLQKLALLGVDFSENRPAELDPAIEYVCIYTSPEDWLRDSQHPAALLDWFDFEYYRTRRSSGASVDRQIARLNFMRYLASDPRALFTTLQQHIQRVSGHLQLLNEGRSQEENKRNLLAYVLGALNDPAMAGTFLDIAHIIRLAAYPNTEIRNLLYLALPSALEDTRARQKQELDGIAFAALRELERFGSSINPWKMPRIIRYETLDPAFQQAGDDQRQLIYTTRLYSEPPGDYATAREDLAAQWADCLLPQLDQDFGNVVVQHEIVNLYSSKKDALTNEMDDLYLVGTQQAQTAIFSRQMLVDLWTDRVAFHVFEQWLQPENTAVTERFRQWAMGERLYDAVTNTEYTPPPLLASIYEWFKSPDYPNTLAGELCSQPVLLTQFVETSLPGGIMDDPFSRKALLDHAYSHTDVNAYHAWLSTALKREFGTLANDKSRQEGTFWSYLETPVATQQMLYSESLRLLVLHLLNQKMFGLKNVLMLLQQVEKALVKAQEVLARLLQYKQKMAVPNIGDMEYVLEFYLQYLNTLPRPAGNKITALFKKPDPHFENYAATAYEIGQQLRQETALSRIAHVIAGMTSITRQVLQQVAVWDQSLLEGLYTRLQAQVAHQGTLDLSPMPYRYWMLDQKWSEKQYEHIFTPAFAESLLKELRWRIDANWILEPMINKRIFDTRLTEEWLDENYQLWRDYIQQAVNTRLEHFNMWAYTESPDAEKAHVQQVADFLGGSSLLLDYNEKRLAGIKRHPRNNTFLVMPREIQVLDKERAFRERLQKTLNLTTAYVNERYNTRLARLSMVENIPLASINAYQRASEYFYSKKLFSQQRALFSVFPQEVQATRYEAEIEEHFNLSQFRFSNNLVMALGNRERVELFVWIQAVGLLQQTPYDSFSDLGYVLELSKDQRWWLTEPPHGSLDEAFVRFCMGDVRPLIFGDQAIKRRMPLDYPAITKAVQAFLQSAAQEWLDRAAIDNRSFPDAEIRQWVHDQQDTPCAFEAAKAGFTFMVFNEQQKDSERALQSSPATADERDLHRLCVLVSKRISSQYRQKIKRMVETKRC